MKVGVTPKADSKPKTKPGMIKGALPVKIPRPKDKEELTKAIAYFDTKENRRECLNRRFEALNLHTLSDINNNNSEEFLEDTQTRILLTYYYNNNIEKMLTTIYPNYPFTFKKAPTIKRSQISQKEVQREYMTDLFNYAELKTMDELQKIPRTAFYYHKGGKDLLAYYKNDIMKLLTTIFPNYPFESSDQSPLNFRTIENQRQYMNELFGVFGLKRMEEWCSFPLQKFLSHDRSCKYLYDYYYDRSFASLLISIYPNYPWHLHFPKMSPSYTLKPSSLTLPVNNTNNNVNIVTFDTKSILSHSSSNNNINMNNNNNNNKNNNMNNNNNIDNMNSHYMNNTNNNNNDDDVESENEKPMTRKYFRSIVNQRFFMEKLYHTLQLQRVGDWVFVPLNLFFKHGGKTLLRYYYSNDMLKLLTSIYPSYPWNFDLPRSFPHLLHNNKHQIDVDGSNSDNENGRSVYRFGGPVYVKNCISKFHDVGYQKKFLKSLKGKLHLRSLNDWKDVSNYQIQQHGGKDLLEYYSYNRELLFSSLYPRHAWNFGKQRKSFGTLKKQLEWMEWLFSELKLSKLDDWLAIPYKTFIQYGGKNLLRNYYENDLTKLLSTLYPSHSWDFSNLKVIEKHRKVLEKLYVRYNFSSLDDWASLSLSKIQNKNFRRVFDYYSNDIKKLLSTVYPLHQWDFEAIRFRRSKKYVHSREYQVVRLKQLIRTYAISQKKDWYRLPLRVGDLCIYKTLKVIYPREKWKKRVFVHRSKRVNQRLLYASVMQLYPCHLLIENYRHPKFVVTKSEHPLEFDIFFPATHLAFEYQGQQHFDDLPAVYGHSELFILHDSLKEDWAKEMKITLITVPYWWNYSSSSLLTSIESASRSLYDSK